MSLNRPLLNGVVNRINLIGVELEGGWDTPVKGHPIEHDGSVHFGLANRDVIDRATGLTIPAQHITPQYGIGEIVSQPMPVDKLKAWLKKCYPQHVNDTCGLHLHISFHHKLNYSRLMTPEYMQTVIRELSVFADRENLPPDHMLRNRLNPKHPWTLQHCQHLYLGDKQVLVAKKDYHSRGRDYSRYTFINYCDKQHNTIECRGLPMFGGQPTLDCDVEMAYRSIMVVIDTTNRFLSRIRRRELKMEAVVPIAEPLTKEIGATIR
jgi:hypothetical protein